MCGAYGPRMAFAGKAALAAAKAHVTWLRQMALQGFAIDEKALKVSVNPAGPGESACRNVAMGICALARAAAPLSQRCDSAARCWRRVRAGRSGPDRLYK